MDYNIVIRFHIIVMQQNFESILYKAIIFQSGILPGFIASVNQD